MRTLVRSFVQLFKKGNQSATKIILLGSGLAMGLVLVAKIYFEQTYENFVPDLNRTYMVYPIYEIDGAPKEWTKTPGAIAPGIKRYSPAIEVATRFTPLAEDIVIKTISSTGPSEKGYKSKRIVLADSSLFDIFSRNIIVGNPKQVLAQPAYAMISKSLAKKLGGENFNAEKIIGLNFAPESALSLTLTVGGIFEDYPQNSELSDIEIILSMPSIGMFMYDGTENWLGNDRYASYVKLHKGAQAADVDAGIKNMCEQHINSEKLERQGVKISYSITPLSSYHASNKDVKRMCNIMLILAFAVLVTAILNYVLIAISALVRKAKTIAVYKCYGANRQNIYSIIFSETFVHLLVSIIVAIMLVFVFQNITEKLIGTSLNTLLSGTSIFILLSICALIFVVCGFLPGMVYSRIPVSTAFRRYKESNRRWKHALLFIQFIASAFFITLLCITMLQYRFMLNSDPGYSFKNIVYIIENGISQDRKNSLKQELAQLPFVADQTFCSSIPIHGASGNNIFLPGEDKQYFNIADMYSVAEGYFNFMGIPIIEGNSFAEENPIGQQVMVSRKFVQKMEKMANWTDGAIGKNIIVTEHSLPNGKDFYTICGVYEDYMIGYIGKEDDRPSVQFFYKSDKDYVSNMSYHLIKLTEITPQNMNALRDKIAELIPDRELAVTSYADELTSLYSETRIFRDSILVASLVVLIITVIGLIGYSHDEINRRRSEIAVRKINGATMAELLHLFLANILKLGIVGVIAGCLLAYFIAGNMMQLFSQRIALSWWIFVVCGLVTLVTISAVVALTTYKAANANPVENLKSE